jgi:hypothetical protein
MAVGFFDGNKADASPDSIKRKREMIARMMASARSPRNIGEGFNAIGNNIAAAMLGYQADTAEKANEAERSRIMGGSGFGGGAPMASAGNPVATGSATGSGATRAPQSFTGTQTEFVAKIMPYAVQEGERTGVDPRIIVAQAALESGYGRSAPGNNFFGIKSHGRPGGQTFATTEVINGQTKRINDSFRTFDSMGDSVRGYGEFLRQNPRYRPMLEAQGMDAQIAALARSGYATDPNYGSKIRSIASGIRMPVISPGPGAAPMPLARQNAQTAPMPNAAPISGDNRAALLADADYYEQNGNVEAARQMRARAGMAGQAQMASAGPQGDAGQDPGYLGAEQYSGAPAMPTSAGNSYADNEEQTRAMEAQMAAEQGLPYAGNEPGPVSEPSLYPPIPMGLGDNPFLPRKPDAMAQVAPPPAPSMDRATFDQITSQTGPIAPTFTGQLAGGVAPSWSENAANNSAGPMGVAPDAPSTVNVPMPPRRPADLAPVQPVVQPSIQQPIQQPPLDQMTFAQQGAANSMDDRFAAQSFASGGMGQAGPRRSILDGLMGGGNSPFVPAAMRGPQPVVPGQSAPMGGSTTAPAAQAQQTGMITPQYVQAVMSSPVTHEADKRFVMDMWNQQVALQRAEADRARTEAQNRQTARDLGIPESLGGVGPVVTARAQQMFGNKTENIPATVAAREAEGRRLGLQGSALQNFALTGQMPVASQDNLDAQVAARKRVAEQNGLKPGDPRYEAYVLTGTMPRPNDQPLSVTDRKIIVDAEDSVINFDNTISILARAKELNPKAYSGFGAGLAGTIGTSGLPGANLAFDPERAKASREFNQLMSGQAIEQMAQTLKGATTEFELKQFVEILGDPSTPPDIRARTIDRMTTLAQRQRDLAISRAKDLRNRDYFKPEDKRGSPSGQTNTPAQGSKVLRYNPKTGALE